MDCTFFRLASSTTADHRPWRLWKRRGFPQFSSTLTSPRFRLAKEWQTKFISCQSPLNTLSRQVVINSGTSLSSSFQIALQQGSSVKDIRKKGGRGSNMGKVLPTSFMDGPILLLLNYDFFIDRLSSLSVPTVFYLPSEARQPWTAELNLTGLASSKNTR